MCVTVRWSSDGAGENHRPFASPNLVKAQRALEKELGAKQANRVTCGLSLLQQLKVRDLLIELLEVS